MERMLNIISGEDPANILFIPNQVCLIKAFKTLLNLMVFFGHLILPVPHSQLLGLEILLLAQAGRMP